VLERGDQASFVEEQRSGLGVGELRPRALDDDDLLEALHPELTREPDLCHAAGRQMPQERVSPELLGKQRLERTSRVCRAHA
jgi:hypothetical protein